ncbi:hypothetical protein HYS96_01765 [Candidatus Daviesbacteria bacterium]|nr:hypothetical protein [Candidatus Daviesbacteria bacterium]
MKERYFREWQDPTAESAIGLADRGRRRRLLSPHGSPIHYQVLSSPLAEIEEKIHRIRTQLAAGVIDSAVYSRGVKSLRSSLRQVRKGGGIK